MRWILYAIYTICCCILLLALYRVFVPPNASFSIDAEIQQTTGQGIVQAISIDVNNDGKANHDSIKAGYDAVLVVKTNSQSSATPTPGDTASSPTTPKMYVFNGAKSLFDADKNFDGHLDGNDPIFGDIQLATFRPNAETVYMPLINAGIVSIYFDPGYLEDIKAGREIGEGAEIGYAVMTDGNRRVMRIVTMLQEELSPSS